jgi:hypothetical protein
MPKFQYIGQPFSRQSPGATIEVEAQDVQEMRKNAHLWQEIDYQGPPVPAYSSCRFRYVGPPFSREAPGAVVEVPGYYVEEIRKSSDWVEEPAGYSVADAGTISAPDPEPAAPQKEKNSRNQYASAERATLIDFCETNQIPYDARWGFQKLIYAIEAWKREHNRADDSQQRAGETA